MSLWVIVIDGPDPFNDCANERVDLALGALAMGDHVLVARTEATLAWAGAKPPSPHARSAAKRLQQVVLFGGELCVCGGCGPDSLPKGHALTSVDKLALRMRDADRVLA